MEIRYRRRRLAATTIVETRQQRDDRHLADFAPRVFLRQRQVGQHVVIQYAMGLLRRHRCRRSEPNPAEKPSHCHFRPVATTKRRLRRRRRPPPRVRRSVGVEVVQDGGTPPGSCLSSQT